MRNFGGVSMENTHELCMNWICDLKTREYIYGMVVRSVLGLSLGLSSHMSLFSECWQLFHLHAKTRIYYLILRAT